MHQGWFPVERCHRVAADVVELSVHAPALARSAQPGQFIGLGVGGEAFALLRRPMGVSAIRGERLAVSFRVAGAGTRWLAARRPGDPVDLLGPLGRGFPDLGEDPVILVGGGVGVARLLPVAERARGEVMALVGFRRGGQVFGIERIRRAGGVVRVATEDGSEGRRGVVTELLEEAIAEGRPGRVLASGPRALLRAVKGICVGRRRAALLALEGQMACGWGVCLGCSTGGLLVCRDGPVFEAEAVEL